MKTKYAFIVGIFIVLSCIFTTKVCTEGVFVTLQDGQTIQIDKLHPNEQK